MAQVEEPKARIVLEATRDLFAATHWGKGSFSYHDDEAGKQKFCAIGGLRFRLGYEPEVIDEEELLGDAAYSVALLALVEVIAEDDTIAAERVAIYGRGEAGPLREQMLDPTDEYFQRTAIECCQDIVVHWNDHVVSGAEEVVAVFNKAIARIPEGETS